MIGIILRNTKLVDVVERRTKVYSSSPNWIQIQKYNVFS
jgi:hypothetical protein